MIKRLLFMSFIMLGANGFAQPSIADVLTKFNTHSVPYINVEALSELETPPLLLDAREIAEYNTSHLDKAIQVGFEDFEISKVINQVQDKTKMIVVYCSIGVRSEKIGEKLIAEGYTAVYNLYGGIFEWVNSDKSVYCNEKQTPNVHAYSKTWGAYLLKGVKVYE
jgi:rhodanese-related sulfurtransferase